MRKLLFLALSLSFFSVQVYSQDIGTDTAALLQKITEKATKDGLTKRVQYISDTTFMAAPGKKFRIVSAFNSSQKDQFRLVVLRQDKDGKTIKAYGVSNATTKKEGEALVITFNLPILAPEATALIMKVIARPVGKVWIFSN